MLDILSITFPIFAIIALGNATVRYGMFSKSEMRTLGKYVLNIALPALLLGAIGQRSLSEFLNISYVVAGILGGLAAITITYFFLTAQGVGPARKGVAAMGASCPNSAFVGFPLMLMLFPDNAAIILALNFVVEHFVVIPACLILLELSRKEEHHSLGKILGNLFLSLLKRPMIMGLLGGLALMIFDIDLPTGIDRLLDILAASASALALFVIGGSLVGLPMRGNTILAAQIIIAKLVLHPAMVFGAVVLISFLGLPMLTPQMETALILTAAMPMFTIYTVLSQDYGHEGLASIALLGATFGSFFTLSALLVFLG